MTLPNGVRRRWRWAAGTVLVLEDTPAGILLKTAPLFPETRPQDVFGSLRHSGPPKSVEEMKVLRTREP